MSKLDAWIDNKIVQNIFVWCCFLLILMGTISSDNKPLTTFYVFLILGPAVYINNFFILPLFKKKRTLSVLFFILNLLVFTLIPYLIIMKSLDKGFEVAKFFNLFGVMFLAITFGITIRIASDSFRRRQQEKEAELKLLKAQLNPHFLFNTLNNLYGLSVVKSDKLPSLMLQLSDLLRYSLYETKEIFVPLAKEISYLENYISLERIRLETQTEISFLVKGNTAGKQIAPMLLIVFVENAFKHLGTAEHKKSSVTIVIEVIDNSLKFMCKNSYDISTLAEEDLEKGKSGIGLVNAKKRLALIYPETHNLSIKKDNGFFLVDVTLAL